MPNYVEIFNVTDSSNSDLVFDFPVVNTSVIPAGLSSDIMRMRIENKNLLSQKGSIYIGTGVYDESNSYLTDVLLPSQNSVIISKPSSTEGIQFLKVGPSSFESTNALFNITVRHATVTTYAEYPNEATRDKGTIEYRIAQAGY